MTIVLNEDQASKICDLYCMWPYLNADMEEVCKECPMTEGEQKDEKDGSGLS